MTFSNLLQKNCPKYWLFEMDFMKTAHQTISDLCAIWPFVGVPMNAPECSATFPNSAQVIDLIKLIFGGGGG